MITAQKNDRCLFLLYIIFFVSLVCSFRAVTSITIAAILLVSFAKNKLAGNPFFNRHINNNFFISCCIFFVIQLLLFISSHPSSTRLIELKTAIVFVPLMLCCSYYNSGSVYKKLMQWFIRILAAGMLVCLLIALYKYFFQDSGNAVFFYHALVGPFNQHAILVSILLFTGIAHLMEMARKGSFIINKAIHFLLLFYFTGSIILLSSKLVIVFTAACLIYYLYLVFKTNLKLRTISLIALITSLAMITLVLITHNKVSKRFNEIIETNMDLVNQREFDPGIYFNGIQFRMLQWRFVNEILSERNAWLTGVSGQSQQLLDAKYISTHMYIGSGKPADHGYLGYNTHNQFMECLLQSGIAGLLAFLFVCITMIRLVMKRKSRELAFVVALLLAYSFSDSLLERQYGIIIFTFFPLFIYYGSRKTA